MRPATQELYTWWRSGEEGPDGYGGEPPECFVMYLYKVCSRYYLNAGVTFTSLFHVHIINPLNPVPRPIIPAGNSNKVDWFEFGRFPEICDWFTCCVKHEMRIQSLKMIANSLCALQASVTRRYAETNVITNTTAGWWVLFKYNR